MEGLKEMMESMSGSMEPKIYEGDATKDKEELTKLQNLFVEKEIFQVGDFIEWKDEKMSYTKVPLIGQPAIVVEILDEPVSDVEGYGTPNATHKNDIIVGMFGSENKFMCFYMDSRRFKKSLTSENESLD